MIERYKKYLQNISWIIVEKFFSMGLSFIVMVFVARYLGPEQFGVLSYAVSLVGLFAVAGHMGLHGLIVREIVNKIDTRDETLGTTFILKVIGVSIGFIGVVMFTIFFEDTYSDEFWVLLIVSLSILVQPFRVIDFWFSAHIQAKYTSISNISGVIFISIFKLTLVMTGASLILFAAASFIKVIVSLIVLIYLYKQTSSIPLSEWKFSYIRAKELLSQGWMIFLGSIFAVIYFKVDQVMIKWLIGSEEVGIYSVASSLSEAWYFLPPAIVASFFPRLIKLREENESIFLNRLQKLFDFLFILAFIVAISVTLFAKPVILLLFGEEYIESASILIIHIWAALFIFMRAAFSKWILIENVLMFSLLTQGFGALSNVLLNLLLIPYYGGKGAALATLFSYAIASFFSLLVYSKTRPIFWMMCKAIVSPIVYPYTYVKERF